MYKRDIVETLADRLREPRKFIQIVAGPRQTGKTTAIKQAINESGIPGYVVSADGIAMKGSDWLELHWLQARQLCTAEGEAAFVIDEIQKIPNWSETVKRLWDEDSWNDFPLKVVLSGSSSLLLKKGLSESLAGRFEIIRSTHWSLIEMKEAFGYSLDDFLLYGGYPGAADLRDNPDRWFTYMRDSIIEATISQDVMLMEDIRKPALMRALFGLGIQYSGQEISYRKLLGQLDDRGNADTIAHYLTLLDDAGMLAGLEKYDDKAIKQRKSSPRLLAYDTSLMTISWESSTGIITDPAARGHLVETAVGAHLLALCKKNGARLYWWRERDYEVDFVIVKGMNAIAIEVKSGTVSSLNGLNEFRKLFPKAKTLIVGEGYTDLEAFLEGRIDIFE